jgi:Flp pilus assembly protein TadD
LALKLRDRLQDALVEFRKAAALDPNQADIHYTLGVTLWQQGEFDKAVEELRAAIKVQPSYAEAHYTLGTVLKQQGNLAEAAAALHEAIRLNPEFAGAYTTLGGILRQQGDSEGAAAAMKTGAEIAKRTTDLQAATFATNSGRRLLNAGDLDGAISQFRSAINSLPTYPQAHYQLGVALQRKGAKEEAAQEFKKAAELDPKLRTP